MALHVVILMLNYIQWNNKLSLLFNLVGHRCPRLWLPSRKMNLWQHMFLAPDLYKISWNDTVIVFLLQAFNLNISHSHILIVLQPIIIGEILESWSLILFVTVAESTKYISPKSLQSHEKKCSSLLIYKICPQSQILFSQEMASDDVDFLIYFIVIRRKWYQKVDTLENVLGNLI